MKFEIQFEPEEDSRWIAEIERQPGVLANGKTRSEACMKVESLAREVVQERSIS